MNKKKAGNKAQGSGGDQGGRSKGDIKNITSERAAAKRKAAPRRGASVAHAALTFCDTGCGTVRLKISVSTSASETNRLSRPFWM